MAPPRRCTRCPDGALRQVAETISVALPRSRVTASATVPARRCTRCGGVRVDGAVLERCRLAIACELADAGVRTGEALRHMRKALGLRAVDMARLLGVTPETISHWETDKIAPGCAAFVAVAAMVQDARDGRTTTRDRLAALSEGRGYPPTLTVRVR